MEWQMNLGLPQAGTLASFGTRFDERGRKSGGFYPRNGQIRSITYTGYHDRSISCLPPPTRPIEGEVAN